MTNEQIREKATDLLRDIGVNGNDPQDDEIASEAFREFAVELLEEAAQTAEEFLSEEPWYDTHSSEIGEADAIAAAIRELKSSLEKPS